MNYLSSDLDVRKYSILIDAIEKIIVFTAGDIPEIKLRERKAIKINREDDIFSTVINIKVKHGHDVQEKCIELQKRLMDSMNKMLNIRFDSINIRVIGVFI
jgi:hypothetical protein